MELIPILLISLSLAMDAFAVSITCGIKNQGSTFSTASKVAALFGIFQAIMPFIGWLAGFKLRDLIAPIDHWIVFGLLLIIGIKMIYESFAIKKEEQERGKDLRLLFLVGLAIATSIDAFAVGISFVLLNVSIILPIICIGIVTFILSFIGVYIGCKSGSFFENKFEALGGFILIGLGIKTLIEHLS